MRTQITVIVGSTKFNVKVSTGIPIIVRNHVVRVQYGTITTNYKFEEDGSDLVLYNKVAGVWTEIQRWEA